MARARTAPSSARTENRMRIRRPDVTQSTRAEGSGTSVGRLTRWRGRVRRAALPLAGTLLVGLALIPAAGASARSWHPARPWNLGHGGGAALRGPVLWSPGVP